jgi:hypothetical protein
MRTEPVKLELEFNEVKLMTYALDTLKYTLVGVSIGEVMALLKKIRGQTYEPYSFNR